MKIKTLKIKIRSQGRSRNFLSGDMKMYRKVGRGASDLLLLYFGKPYIKSQNSTSYTESICILSISVNSLEEKKKNL